MANSVDPDQTAPYEQSGLGLHCLTKKNFSIPLLSVPVVPAQVSLVNLN